MNKKIKLLIMKAGGIICSTVETDTIDKIDYHHFDAEKFAELIVRECAKVCDDLDIDDWGDKSFDDGTYYCSRAIKLHFGVEE